VWRPQVQRAAWAALAVGALLLAGCGSTPKQARPGGFYQDDGPPDRVPADLARVADAVPKVEPFHPYANRPYSALGRTYTPITDDRPFRQRGLASWYGRQFHGNRTSSGEKYDMLAMTAAHPTLPIPSYVRVTSLRNGASVVVRVNDRGPFKPDRVIDLSYAAAVRLGIAAAGTGEVEVVRLTHADIRAGRTQGAPTAARGDEAPPALPASPRAPLPPPASALAPTTSPAVASLPAPGSSATAPAAAAPSAASMAAGAATAARWSVQLGAFGVAANAEALRDRVAVLLAQGDGALAAEASPRVERDGNLHRVLAGAFADRAGAAQLAARLERALDRETALYQR
jgi:rare lipoprotein A